VVEKMKDMPYGSVWMCAEDFSRALYERGRFLCWIFKLVVGKYAYREYEMMIAMIEISTGLKPDIGYGLEECNYHKRTMEELRAGWIGSSSTK
jgi:hypothetical protein